VGKETGHATQKQFLGNQNAQSSKNRHQNKEKTGFVKEKRKHKKEKGGLGKTDMTSNTFPAS